MNAMNPAPQAPYATILQYWHQPHPAFTSGQDARSSENALLVLMYGSLEKAARFGWLNAGRTLIDKTYLRILWATQGLESAGTSFDELAARLDGFIRTELKSRWDDLDKLEHEERHQLTLHLVEQMQTQVFQSSERLNCTTWLLFFLCPQLPVFPYANTRRASCDYGAWHPECRQRLINLIPRFCNKTPKSCHGSAQEQQVVTRLLAQGDWWPRRMLAQQMRNAVA